MSVLATKVNADPALAAIPIHSDEACNQVGGMPVLATPATIVGVAAGVGLVGSVAALFGAGYVVGRNLGGTTPRPK
ncbi:MULTISPECIES: hypothetical protein [Micromonospora]|uniref:Uncharacterized protein n=1 Tax=Micromonospora yangpuensis TaxID=683228 RepID=A0A1C6VGC0_9ACTN|nr:hypothetical protein [Micromonospora yangpuensis]GGM32359.1 hypothetical protein GCM10012279_59110 [Micromonospora yangpuensis]SCL65341.1 hypothetical protein GA0070617_5736 [Micromonospora yangpuensis]